MRAHPGAARRALAPLASAALLEVHDERTGVSVKYLPEGDMIQITMPRPTFVQAAVVGGLAVGAGLIIGMALEELFDSRSRRN